MLTRIGLISLMIGSNMGYYTAYSLDLYGDPDDIYRFKEALIDEYRDKKTGQQDPEIKELLEVGAVYAKLYGLDNVLHNLAYNHPDVLIVLSGDGEESDDNWEQRMKGADIEFHEMIMPPFENPNLQIPKKNNS